VAPEPHVTEKIVSWSSKPMPCPRASAKSPARETGLE